MRNGKLGFTLIELLVALLILAIIGALMVTGLNVVIRAQTRVTENADRLSGVQSAVMIMERDIAGITDRAVYTQDGRLHPSVEVQRSGGKLILEFTKMGYVNPLSLQNRSTLQRIVYTLDGTTLVRKTWDSLDQVPNSTPTTTSAPLLTEVKEFTVRFLDYKNRMIVPPTTNISVPSVMPVAIELNLNVTGIGIVTRLIPLSSQPQQNQSASPNS